jgi:hypothetical protein
MDLFPHSGEGVGDTSLGPLEGANLNHCYGVRDTPLGPLERANLSNSD